MADIFPFFENIDRLKVKPTDGEAFALNWLVENLSDKYEVYFQPFLNGDMPDIIVMRRDYGVIIIEVKDWDLNSYSIDYKNQWIVTSEEQPIKSPFQQVFGYKSHLFKLHISGLAEKLVLNRNVYHIIKPYVYFHKASRNDVDNIYSDADKYLRLKINENNIKYAKEKIINFAAYEKSRHFFERKTRQIRRDKGIALTQENITKLLDVLNYKNSTFTDELYYEFRRYLRPPFHVKDMGKKISYGKKQSKLIVSKPTLQKIKGVAGSGKTSILAKRAVNAHKRHQDRVLILTYNLTLRNQIRDKISDVRENFSWDSFVIINYHSFITHEMNKNNIDTDDMVKKLGNIDKVYSYEFLFDHCSDVTSYKTILIDEAQDYKPEWIRIVKKYFLEDDGEMVLFADECQNIYERNISKSNPALIRGEGFGRWERLTKSYRANIESPLINMIKNFQEQYLVSKYDADIVQSKEIQLSFAFDLFKGVIYSSTSDLDGVFEYIYNYLQKEELHPNDVTIIAKDVALLRKLDKIIRDNANEETMTTFETEEVYLELSKRPINDTMSRSLDAELEQIRKGKKFAFNLNNGQLKLSTIHSFKGLESRMIIYILTEHENPELVYTGITRSMKDFLIILPESNEYLDFFSSQIGLKFDQKIDQAPIPV